MPSTNRVLLVPVCLGALCLAQCDKEQPAPAPQVSAMASAAPSQKAPEKPWFVGEWHAPLQVERYQIEQTKQEGKIKAWAEDSGDKATGKGELILTIDESGSVTGKATGPLGELQASGTLDGEALRVRLQPTATLDPPELFSGVLLAQKENGGFSGDLKASSGDSLTVRKASVKLAKREDDAAKAKAPKAK